MVNEGVVLVGDRYVVVGGVRQGFFANVMPAPVRVEIRRNARIPIPPQTISFPHLDMLCPIVGRIAVEVAAVPRAGYGEVNLPPVPEPADVPEVPAPSTPVIAPEGVTNVPGPAGRRGMRNYPPIRADRVQGVRARQRLRDVGQDRSNSV